MAVESYVASRAMEDHLHGMGVCVAEELLEQPSPVPLPARDRRCPPPAPATRGSLTECTPPT